MLCSDFSVSSLACKNRCTVAEQVSDWKVIVSRESEKSDAFYASANGINKLVVLSVSKIILRAGSSMKSCYQT